MVMWTNTASTPPTIVRFGFLAILTFPLFYFKPALTPIVLTLFLTTSMNSFSMSFMPASRLFYIIIVLAIVIINYQKQHMRSQIILVALFLTAFLTNLLMGKSELSAVNDYYFSLLMVFMFPFLIEGDDPQYPHLFSYAFILTSLALSLLYLLFGDQFTGATDDMERAYWMDPNYWGMVVGMGATAALIELFFNKNNKILLTAVLILTIVVSVPTLFLVASRGAVLSFAIVFVIIIIASKAKKWVKLIAVIGATVFVVLLYNNGYMDIFLYRVLKEGTLEEGGGRLNVWRTKIHLFLNSNPIHWIIGFGNEMGTRLGGSQLSGGRYMGFHNDYLAYLVEYGLLGLILFLYWILSPLRKATHNRSIVLGVTAYVATCCFTLEPITIGNFPYFAFLFYGYVWSRSPESVEAKNMIK